MFTLVWMLFFQIDELKNKSVYSKIVIPFLVDVVETEEKVANLSEDSMLEKDILLNLIIPSINLKRNVYTRNSVFNDVDQNVELLDGTIIDKNLFFLAAHSGNSEVSFFKDIDRLEKGDFVYLLIDGKELGYVVEKLFYIEKSGLMWYVEGNYNLLYLITCSENDFSKQLVVECKLI